LNIAVVNNGLAVLHGVLSLDVGGLERIVVDLASIAAGRQRVEVVTVERPGMLAEGVRLNGVPVHDLGKPPGRRKDWIAKAEECLTRIRPDVVHTHQIGAAWYLGPAAKRLGIPVLHTEHGNVFAREPGIRAQIKNRLLYRRTAEVVNRFCCVSQEIADAMARWRTVPRSKIRIVPNGVDLGTDRELSRGKVRGDLGIPDSAWVVGTVGRLHEVKRQDLLLRAAFGLSRRAIDAWVLLVGEGPERKALEALVQELGIAERTRFVGYQSDPRPYLSAMDAFALTSRSEGFPVSLLEAWTCGLPTVCTAVGGIPNIVSDRVDGLLVPSGDVPAIEAALQLLANDPELAQRLGRAGLSRVRQDYSLQRMAETYEGLYRDLVVSRVRRERR